MAKSINTKKDLDLQKSKMGLFNFIRKEERQEKMEDKKNLEIEKESVDAILSAAKTKEKKDKFVKVVAYELLAREFRIREMSNKTLSELLVQLSKG